MYAIYAYIGVVLGVNVGIYGIHGVSGIYDGFQPHVHSSNCFGVSSAFPSACLENAGQWKTLARARGSDRPTDHTSVVWFDL